MYDFLLSRGVTMNIYVSYIHHLIIIKSLFVLEEANMDIF